MDLNKEDVVKNKNEAITKLNEYLDSCLLGDNKHIKKTNLLSYWLKDYVGYIEDEDTFDSSKLKEYSRGDIIKVNLGFNVGNEEGGLHYCVVLDKKNAKSHSTLTVVPLSSLKPTTKSSKTSVPLGNDIYNNLFKKYNNLLIEAQIVLNDSQQEAKIINELPEDTEEQKIIKDFKRNTVKKELIKNMHRIELLEKINNELFQMKEGSIALINQITTISKQRIYNPKKDFDILSGIKLSEEKMNLIDEKIKKFYTN